VLILPGDMPLARSADIEAVLAEVPAGTGAPFALLVPSHDRLGTNALLLAPPGIIKLRFGYDSFSFHTSQVVAQGLALRIYENERIALDIDEPKDLERFLSLDCGAGESSRVGRALLRQNAAAPARRSGSL
jgi:2-phospho-L-lactate guanylyltransferase